MNQESKELSVFEYVEELASEYGLVYTDSMNNMCWNTDAQLVDLVKICIRFATSTIEGLEE